MVVFHLLTCHWNAEQNQWEVESLDLKCFEIYFQSDFFSKVYYCMSGIANVLVLYMISLHWCSLGRSGQLPVQV